jgi:hypothetical protein
LAWALLLANSAEEIASRFPELTIVSVKPGWLTDDQEELLRNRMTIDIDEYQGTFLETILCNRTKK